MVSNATTSRGRWINLDGFTGTDYVPKSLDNDGGGGNDMEPYNFWLRQLPSDDLHIIYPYDGMLRYLGPPQESRDKKNCATITARFEVIASCPKSGMKLADPAHPEYVDLDHNQITLAQHKLQGLLADLKKLPWKDFRRDADPYGDPAQAEQLLPLTQQSLQELGKAQQAMQPKIEALEKYQKEHPPEDHCRAQTSALPKLQPLA
ncbi:MAG: hypothetical protein HY053_00365 [Proteobacteria bacterium]|nr:hypothetical protein [Pseudomonadota bacterium]